MPTETYVLLILRRDEWNYVKEDPQNWISLYSWQTNPKASGVTYLRVVNENINGKQVSVLEEESKTPTSLGEDKMYVLRHYYQTPELAKQQGNTNYPDDSKES